MFINCNLKPSGADETGLAYFKQMQSVWEKWQPAAFQSGG